MFYFHQIWQTIIVRTFYVGIKKEIERGAKTYAVRISTRADKKMRTPNKGKFNKISTCDKFKY